MTLLVLFVSLAVVTLGAEALVRGASTLALRAGVSGLFVGLTIVGFGTSSPELAASLTATLRGSSEVSVGTVVGSNIFNIGVILGITATIQPIRIALTAVRRDLLVGIAVCVVPALSLLAGGHISRGMGFALLAGLLLYLALAYRAARGSAQQDLARAEVQSSLALDPAGRRWTDRKATSVAMVVVGLAMLVIGSRFFVGSAMELAGALGIPEVVIGLTIVSVGTSFPELVTSVIAARRRNPDIAIGNVIGSGIFNLLGILGASAAVAPQVVPRGVALIDTPVMLLATCALLPVIRSGGSVSRKEGVVLLLGYVTYVALLAARGA